MDDPDLMVWPILLQIFLILLNAIFACGEIAVISINDNKLEKLSSQGNKRAQRLLSLTKEPAKFLATIQVGITLAGFLGSAFAADNFSHKLVEVFQKLNLGLSTSTLNSISVVIITLILSYFTLVFGELVPKRIGMSKAEKIGLAMSGLVCTMSKVFAPLVWLLTASTNGILRLLSIDPNENQEAVTEEEIRMMVDVGTIKGAIDQEEKEFIHNVFEFDNKIVEDIMTHRTDVTLLWLEDDDLQWEETINQSRFSIYPICGESADDVKGLLSAKEYLRLKDKSRDVVMGKAVKAVWFVPETIRADNLFQSMKKNRTHFAVVVDEYGGMGGIITLSDLVEELLGDLDDTEPVGDNLSPIEKVGSQTWVLQGSTPIEVVEKELNVTLPSDEYNTFSGLVFAMLGVIPPDGSTPEIEGYGLHVKVTHIQNHKVNKCIVTVLNKPENQH